uniref:Uncharacterized protein n=1 Tax=Anguilla anguilla TaxID=7936 RepID=A0A0E9QYK5_ANGAN
MGCFPLTIITKLLLCLYISGISVVSIELNFSFTKHLTFLKILFTKNVFLCVFC